MYKRDKYHDRLQFQQSRIFEARLIFNRPKGHSWRVDMTSANTIQTIIFNSITMLDTDGGPDVIIQHGQHPQLAQLKQFKGGHYVEVQVAGELSGIGPLGRTFMSESEALKGVEAALSDMFKLGYALKPAPLSQTISR